MLSTWSKSPRFTLNLTLFNRLPFHPEVERILGDFTSIVLLEVDCSISETFVKRTQRLQEQLWGDSEHSHVSGIQVLRELRKHQEDRRAAMPVVFTSMVGLGGRGIKPSFWTELGEVGFAVVQTPQVLIDLRAMQLADGSLMIIVGLRR